MYAGIWVHDLMHFVRRYTDAGFRKVTPRIWIAYDSEDICLYTGAHFDGFCGYVK